jgi:hypothetical protein
MTKITKNSFEKASKNTGGILTHIAKNLKCSRTTVYEFIEINREFCEKILNQEREEITDMAEGQLFRNIKDNQPWSIKYYLSTIGKTRGYFDKTEVEVKGFDPSKPLSEDEKKDLLREIKK